ncbi:unnamed protein product [Callosobruchus maculatus]|uniref:Saposin B-type domain-containing protein n=1 Tax=Callosobruchus maculatus TaxID=64391 RepID=A0A653DRE3_CALMS|nr:unnamed protein product [Callosobruchus maculatus]
MYARVFLVLGCLITILQVSHQAADPRLKQCSKKLVEHIEKLDFRQPPKCLDKGKLANVIEAVGIFKNFYDSLPRKCKSTVFMQNVKMCAEVFIKKLQERSEELKSSIIQAIISIFGASRGCIVMASEKLNTLDKWVLEGCPDK